MFFKQGMYTNNLKGIVQALRIFLSPLFNLSQVFLATCKFARNYKMFTDSINSIISIQN